MKSIFETAKKYINLYFSKSLHRADSKSFEEFEKQRCKNVNSIYKRFSDYRLNVFNRAAFTLAEVIIVIGVVGLVAALTLPTLISNHKKNVYTNQLKKAYSRLINAYKWQFDGVPIDEYCSYVSQDECTRMLAKAMGATDIMLLGENTERLAYARTLNFSRDLLATIDQIFTPAAWASSYDCASYDCSNYSDSYDDYSGYYSPDGGISGGYTNSNGAMCHFAGDFKVCTDDGSLTYQGLEVAKCKYLEHSVWECSNSNNSKFGGYLSNGTFNSTDGSSLDSLFGCGSFDCGAQDCGGYGGSYDCGGSDDSYDCGTFDCGGSDDSYDCGTFDCGGYKETFYGYKETPSGLDGNTSIVAYPDSTAIRTKDGTVYYFTCGGYYVFIDVDGPKRGPNIGGRDIFLFKKQERMPNQPPLYRIVPYEGSSVCDKLNVSVGCTQKLLSEGKMNY